MNTNDLNTALYEKMAAEQDKYRDWLKSQPPEEILHHTYEYTIREDIVMAIEELELTDTQAQALLESSLPLADVYRYFEKLETGHMDVHLLHKMTGASFFFSKHAAPYRELDIGCSCQFFCQPRFQIGRASCRERV